MGVQFTLQDLWLALTEEEVMALVRFVDGNNLRGRMSVPQLRKLILRFMARDEKDL
jgi:hypothetical protein